MATASKAKAYMCPLDRYECRNELVKSAMFGDRYTIYKAFDREKGVEVAWHQFSAKDMSAQEQKDFLDEIALLVTINHPSLLNVEGGW